MEKTEIFLYVIAFVLCFLVGAILVYFIVNYYKNTKKAIALGLKDDEIIKERKAKLTKKNKTINIIGNVFSGAVATVFAACIVFGIFAKTTNNNFPLGDKTALVIKTGSMSTINKNNTYLVENNLHDQFEAYSIIEVHKLTGEENIKKYDIVVYECNGQLIVHRIIDIKQSQNEDFTTKYETRGDANPTSDPITITYDNLVGIYSSAENNIEGKSIPFVGYLVLFFQSPLGLFAFVILLAYVLITPYVDNKLEKFIDTRLREIGCLDANNNFIENESKKTDDKIDDFDQ